MVRKFTPFDAAIVKAEMMELAKAGKGDISNLTHAMEQYQSSFSDVLPAVIRSGYPEGILEIRHVNGYYKGRGLFFAETAKNLALLVVYRKSTNKTPQSIIDLAVSRKRKY